MNGKIKYDFSAEIWRHPTGWQFVSLPKNTSKEIRENLQWQEEGWGRLKATAQIGATKWETAIWFASQTGHYLLPLKAEIRKKEKLEIHRKVAVTVWV